MEGPTSHKKEPIVTLQRARESDIEELIEQERSVPESITYSPAVDTEEWKETLAKEEVFLIKVVDQVVGNVSLERKGEDHLYISGLLITPDFQRKGVARKVMERILNSNQEVARIDLVTHPENPALALYQSLGFQIESRKENYFGDGEPRLVLALNKL